MESVPTLEPEPLHRFPDASLFEDTADGLTVPGNTTLIEEDFSDSEIDSANESDCEEPLQPAADDDTFLISEDIFREDESGLRLLAKKDLFTIVRS